MKHRTKYFKKNYLLLRPAIFPYLTITEKKILFLEQNIKLNCVFTHIMVFDCFVNKHKIKKYLYE